VTAPTARAPESARARTGAFIVSASMRLLARWLALRSSVSTQRAQAPLSVAVHGARTILVAALAEAGDMVLLSVFLRELRRLAPSARVTLVCLPAVRGLFELSVDVDEVIAFDATMPRLRRPFRLPGRARDFVRCMHLDQIDVAVVPRWDTDQHLASAIAVFSRAPRRVWHSEHSTERKAMLNAGFDTLFTDVVRSVGVRHEVERHLDMLRAMGASNPSHELGLALSTDDRARAANALATIGTGGPIVALGIGAAHSKRRWPISRFAEVAQRLQRDHNAHIVVVGGPPDVEAQAELLRGLGPAATGVAGALTLRESAAVLERCRVFIGNDSAPVHLAAASRIPCVEISCHPTGGDPFHHNAPERFGPWGVPSKVVRPPAAVPPCSSSCAQAEPHCILAVTPAMVLEAVGELLRRPVTAESQASAAPRA
jgi:heptosyltransferase-3